MRSWNPPAGPQTGSGALGRSRLKKRGGAPPADTPPTSLPDVSSHCDAPTQERTEAQIVAKLKLSRQTRVDISISEWIRTDALGGSSGAGGGRSDGDTDTPTHTDCCTNPELHPVTFPHACKPLPLSLLHPPRHCKPSRAKPPAPTYTHTHAFRGPVI